MGLGVSSSYQRKRLVAAEYQVSPITKKGVPSAVSSAWWLAVARRNPRRNGLACFSASVQSRAINEPFLPERPGVWGSEPLVHAQRPGAVATTRTLNVLSPSQNP